MSRVIPDVQVMPFFDGFTKCCSNRVKFKVKERYSNNELGNTYFKCAKCLVSTLFTIFDLPISPTNNLFPTIMAKDIIKEMNKL